jgi:hypothetical protein
MFIANLGIGFFPLSQSLFSSLRKGEGRVASPGLECDQFLRVRKRNTYSLLKNCFISPYSFPRQSKSVRESITPLAGEEDVLQNQDRKMNFRRHSFNRSIAYSISHTFAYSIGHSKGHANRQSFNRSIAYSI